MTGAVRLELNCWSPFAYRTNRRNPFPQWPSPPVSYHRLLSPPVLEHQPTCWAITHKQSSIFS